MNLDLSDGTMYKIRTASKHFPADSDHEMKHF